LLICTQFHRLGGPFGGVEDPVEVEPFDDVGGVPLGVEVDGVALDAIGPPANGPLKRGRGL